MLLCRHEMLGLIPHAELRLILQTQKRLYYSLVKLALFLHCKESCFNSVDILPPDDSLRQT